MNATHPTFLNIPNNAMLIAFGNCFYSAKYGWQIAAYFRLPTQKVELISLAIETLPVLAIGRIYKQGRISVERKESAHFSLPPIATWEKLTIENLPKALHEIPYKNECQNQLVYKITLGQRVFWLPVLELARVLFLKTAENTRRAFYEPSLVAMADLDLSQEQATIRLSKHYPRKLLDTKAHQEYLAWLLLNPTVTKSFCSIYQSKHFKSSTSSNYQRWIFDFEPFEPQDVSIHCFVNSHEQEYFIYEISSMARIPSTTQYKSVVIEHPEDFKYRPPKENDTGSNKNPREKKVIGVSTSVDDKKPPSGHSKHRVLDIPKGRLHFNAMIEPERHFTEIEVERNPEKPPTQTKQEGEEKLGVTEGDSKSKSRKADFKALADPKAEPADFFKHIRFALQHIQNTQKWQITERTGELSHEKKKSFLSVAGVKRRYFYAEIMLFGNVIANILEIDLTDKHGLSTIVLRLPPDSEADEIDMILTALVEKSGRWDRELIHELTEMCAYVAHPKDLSEETEKLVYENWASRIISEL